MPHSVIDLRVGGSHSAAYRHVYISFFLFFYILPFPIELLPLLSTLSCFVILFFFLVTPCALGLYTLFDSPFVSPFSIIVLNFFSFRLSAVCMNKRKKGTDDKDHVLSVVHLPLDIWTQDLQDFVFIAVVYSH